MGDERRGANRSSMSPASFAMRWSARSSLNTRIDAHQGAASLQCDLVLTRRAMLFSPLIESQQGRNRNEQNDSPDRRCRRPCLHRRRRQRAGRACFGHHPRQARQCHTGHGFGRAGVLAPPLALPSPPALAPLVVVSAASTRPTTVVTMSPPRHCGGEQVRQLRASHLGDSTPTMGEPGNRRATGLFTCGCLTAMRAGRCLASTSQDAAHGPNLSPVEGFAPRLELHYGSSDGICPRRQRRGGGR